MVYALQKFKHYLLGSHFKMFTDHSALKYLVNDPGGYRWPPTIPLAQNSYFRLAVFLAVFGSQTSGAVLRP